MPIEMSQVRSQLEMWERQEIREPLTSLEYYRRAGLRMSLIENHGFITTYGLEKLAEEGLNGVFTRDRVQAMEVQVDLERSAGHNGRRYLDVLAKAHSRMGRLQTWLFERHLIDWEFSTGRIQSPRWAVRFQF